MSAVSTTALVLTPFGALPMCHGAGGLGGPLSFRGSQRHGSFGSGTCLARLRSPARRGWFGDPRRHASGRAGGAAPNGRWGAGADETAVRPQTVVPARHRDDGGCHYLGRSFLGPSCGLPCRTRTPRRYSPFAALVPHLNLGRRCEPVGFTAAPHSVRNRSRRSAFAVTSTVAPVSARIAIQSVVTPTSVVTRNTPLSPSASPMFCQMFASVARDSRMSSTTPRTRFFS